MGSAATESVAASDLGSEMMEAFWVFWTAEFSMDELVSKVQVDEQAPVPEKPKESSYAHNRSAVRFCT